VWPRRVEIQKGRRTSFPSRTRRPSLPIISSLEALLARRLFHSTHSHLIVHRSSYCLPPGIRCNRPHLCQVLYRHLQAASNLQAATQEATPLASRNDSAPAMWRCQSPIWQEIRSSNQTVVAHASGIPIRLSALMISLTQCSMGIGSNYCFLSFSKTYTNDPGFSLTRILEQDYRCERAGSLLALQII